MSREDEFWAPEPLFEGETVFCLASGPSLTAATCERLRGQRVLAVNTTWRLCQWADAWFFTDSGFFERVKADVAICQSVVITMSRAAKREMPDRVLRVRGEHTTGFPPAGSPFIRQGRSSGHSAVSALVSMGARKIALVGFDMRIVDGREHHHVEYGGPRDTGIYDREFVPAFAGWNADALKAGVEIVNCTPGSAVTEFPFADLDEVVGCSAR